MERKVVADQPKVPNRPISVCTKFTRLIYNIHHTQTTSFDWAHGSRIMYLSNI
ncbi:hypothetical protein Hanom_Chr09g00827501 [Helianthus anomalus]